jgi:hypothetical protein
MNENNQDSKVMQVSVRGWIAMIVVLTVCYMSAFQLIVAEPLYTLATITVGFYFGQKTSGTKTP